MFLSNVGQIRTRSSATLVRTARVREQRRSERHVFISDAGQNSTARVHQQRWSEQGYVVVVDSGTDRQRVVVDSAWFRTTIRGRRQVVDAQTVLFDP